MLFLQKKSDMKVNLPYILIIILTIALTGCGSSQKNGDQELIPTDVVKNPQTANKDSKSKQMPGIEFERSEYNFGKIIEGEVVSFGFKFTNTGESDLLISTVRTSCGCTASEYPEKPIKPGDEGVVKITFNSKGRHGFQKKTAVVIANTQPSKIFLIIKAKIYQPEN